MRSHHSHSGDYILHAKDSLDDIVEQAIARGFKSYCLTEHIPRNSLADLYPEEKHLQVSDLESNFDKFYHHARQLQSKYADQITLLVGCETDYIRPDFKSLIAKLRTKYNFDMFVGSIHHVKQVPIDLDLPTWELAMRKCGAGTPRDLYAAYFDEQYAMIVDLKPPIVGHFDLIRLFSMQDSEKSISQWPEVLAKVERNLDYIIAYGGLIELNSAAVRKGWTEPYPRADICKMVLDKGGQFCLSDDSHGIAQVGLNFHKTLEQIEKLGITELSYFDLENGEPVVRKESIAVIKTEPFWAQYKNQ
ncbi:polymerase/histidinol phosphatase-like protein [Lipomyces kononenkoae]